MGIRYLPPWCIRESFPRIWTIQFTKFDYPPWFMVQSRNLVMIVWAMTPSSASSGIEPCGGSEVVTRHGCRTLGAEDEEILARTSAIAHVWRRVKARPNAARVAASGRPCIQ